MFNYLILFYNYFKLFLGISLFSYIYKICFDSCNQKVNIKTKHNKTKQTIKSKIGLSLLYLFLTTILYYTLTLRVVLTLLSTFALGIVFALDKFDPESLEILSIYDKNKIVRYGWKIMYSGISVLFISMTPVHNYITEHVNNIKNKTTKKFNEGLMGGLINKDIDMGSNLKRMIKEITTEVKKMESSSTSAMSDYLMRDNAKIAKDKVSMSSKNIITEETETELETDKVIIRQLDEKIEIKEEIQEKKVEIVEEDKKVEELDMSVENKNIKPEDETEKVLEMMKKMTEIFSHEKQADNEINEPNIEIIKANEANEPNEPNEYDESNDNNTITTENSIVEGI
jgi:hypothetical protein